MDNSRILAAFLLVCFFVCIGGQVIKVSNENPKKGDTVRIWCDSKTNNMIARPKQTTKPTRVEAESAAIIFMDAMGMFGTSCGNALKATNRFSKDGNKLKITNIQVEDGQYYCCIPVADVDSNCKRINVKAPPLSADIENYRKGQTVKGDQDAEIPVTCKGQSQYDGTTLEVYSGSQKITKLFKQIEFKSEIKEKSTCQFEVTWKKTLQAKNLKLVASYNKQPLRCVTTVPGLPAKEDNIMLSIKIKAAPLKLTDCTRSVSVQKKETAILMCRTKISNEKPKIFWTFSNNGSPRNLTGKAEVDGGDFKSSLITGEGDYYKIQLQIKANQETYFKTKYVLTASDSQVTMNETFTLTKIEGNGAGATGGAGTSLLPTLVTFLATLIITFQCGRF